MISFHKNCLLPVKLAADCFTWTVLIGKSFMDGRNPSWSLPSMFDIRRTHHVNMLSDISIMLYLSIRLYNKELGMTLTISNKGWVVIPAELRKKYNLLPGTEVVIVDYGGVLAIIPALRNPVKQGRGLLRELPSLSQDLLKERAAERSREEGKIG